eukprot:TRINITY_DN37544_c0_g1_i1.p1 TRINITY_DN37544_c0_g1~~TRINITY_DN37544_c0_g1_i1.p1  ORF type:complete len:226 (+),score=25.16 TRINITY_DN37544_c0_g1_i1:80-679(+)
MRKQFLILVVIGYLIGTAVFTGGWVAQTIELDSKLQRLHVVHFASVVVAVLVATFLLLSAIAGIEGQDRAKCILHVGLSLMVISYGLFGATIGINSYLLNNDCELIMPDQLTQLSDSSSTPVPSNSTSPVSDESAPREPPSCDLKLITIQFFGAGMASLALFVKMVYLQQNYKSITSPSELSFMVRQPSHSGEMMLHTS